MPENPNRHLPALLTAVLIVGAMLMAAANAWGQTTLIPRESVWRYDATGTDLGVAWRDAGFSDAAWDSGNGILGFGEAYINTTIPYGPDPNDKFRTTYFRKTFTLTDPAGITQLLLAANHDDGFVVYLNGVEAARQSMPLGTITFSTFASSHEGGSYQIADLSARIGELVPGENLLAVELHQTSQSSSDLVWDAELAIGYSQIEFMWSGAVTDSSVRVKARMLAHGVSARLAVSESVDLSSPVFSAIDIADDITNDRVVDLAVTGLTPNTQYYYAIEADGFIDPSQPGQFRTFPAPGPASFSIALGSCAQTGSAHVVFDTIAAREPLFFLHTGDFHYQNIGVADPAVFRAAYRTVLASPTQSNLYRHVPITYVWDDHDYGPNNSDSTAPGRTASRLTYQEYIPHYPLTAGSGDVAIYQTFTVGRVKLIVTDCRSARSPWSATDNASKTMLGSDQKAWFKQELLAAQGVYPLIVWVNSLPWIGVTGDDGWYLYTNERREIADFIEANNIRGLCMLSGDAHMLAIDDGRNSGYATGGGGGFPVFHAAALDRGGSVKGGPYSEGAHPGGGQFGWMTVTDTGGTTIGIDWSGLNSVGTERVGLSYSVSTIDGTICMCKCHGDPICDGVTNLSDVAAVIGVAFRGVPAQADPRPACGYEQTDVDCNGVTTVIDAVRVVNVAFRGADIQTEFCDPCGQ